MAWKNIPGLNGRVYVPDDDETTPKKHPCKGCFSCQRCSNERCQLCRDCRENKKDPSLIDDTSKTQ